MEDGIIVNVDYSTRGLHVHTACMSSAFLTYGVPFCYICLVIVNSCYTTGHRGMSKGDPHMPYTMCMERFE